MQDLPELQGKRASPGINPGGRSGQLRAVESACDAAALASEAGNEVPSGDEVLQSNP